MDPLDLDEIESQLHDGLGIVPLGEGDDPSALARYIEDELARRGWVVDVAQDGPQLVVSPLFHEGGSA